jgi:hypothetical protein
MEARFAGGNMGLLIFFHNHGALCAWLWKKMGSSALPEANRAVRPGEHLVWN